MRNVVPFKAPETFKQYGIDWTREPRSDREKALREAFLTYETSAGLNGLASLVLLAVVSRRQGTVGEDLQSAADFAEIMLTMQVRKHQDDVMAMLESYLANGGTVWS